MPVGVGFYKGDTPIFYSTFFFFPGDFNINPL